jgi:Family of unknown function (DUF6084)
MNERVAMDDAGPLAAGSGPAPEFAILGVEPVRYAAAPTLMFVAHVTEATGRDVYTIALTTQIMIAPARRSYDDETREQLVELFGPPERWAATTTNFIWLETDLLVPAFTGATSFRVPIACTYDLELAAVKYFYSVPDGEVPLQFNFTGTIFYRGPGGAMQIAKVPWDCAAEFRMPVEVWKEMVAHYYPHSGWARLHADTLAALSQRRAERGLPSLDATVAALLEETR